MTVYGEGTQTRSFCYVTDTVCGILLMMYSSKCSGEVINIGGGDEIRILDLASKIREIVGCNSKISFKPIPMDDPKRRWPDTNKAKSMLSWAPEVGFDKGLKRTIRWFQTHKPE